MRSGSSSTRPAISRTLNAPGARPRSAIAYAVTRRGPNGTITRAPGFTRPRSVSGTAYVNSLSTGNGTATSKRGDGFAGLFIPPTIRKPSPPRNQNRYFLWQDRSWLIRSTSLFGLNGFTM